MEEAAALKVEIDGNHSEGGGQILRTALALSAITGEQVHVTNIRGKRSPCGLRPQHKTAVETLAHLVKAKVKGLELGSTEVAFNPGVSQRNMLMADIGSAGSTTLVLQSLLPVMLFSGEKMNVEVRGGTNNPFAPPVDYMERVLIPTLARMGATIEFNVKRRGFFPKGGGILLVSTEPVRILDPIDLTHFGNVKGIDGIAFSCRLPSHIVSRMAKTASSILQKEGSWPLQIKQEILQHDSPKCAASPGCGIFLTAELSSQAILGVSQLGTIGRSAEEVGKIAAETLVVDIRNGVPVDEYLADQVLLYMALAKGESSLTTAKLTSHILSCIYVCEQFLGRVFTVHSKGEREIHISSDGVGFCKT